MYSANLKEMGRLVIVICKMPFKKARWLKTTSHFQIQRTDRDAPPAR